MSGFTFTRGTTPGFRLVFPADNPIDEYTTIELGFSQISTINGYRQIKKSVTLMPTQREIASNSVHYRLSQYDSLKFEPGQVDLQVAIVKSTGECYKSRIYRIINVRDTVIDSRVPDKDPTYVDPEPEPEPEPAPEPTTP